MPRLPIPGSDDNSWGTILNNYLSVEHNPDGSLKKASDIVTAQTTADNAQATATAKYTKPSGGIPTSDLAAAGVSEGQVMTFNGGQWQPVSASPMIVSYESVPSDHGFDLWSFNPQQITNSHSYSAGRMTAARMGVPVSTTISQLGIVTRAGGTGGTSLSGAYLALFDKNGTRLGVSSDQAGIWGNGSYGLKMATLTPDFNGALNLIGGSNEYVFAAVLLVRQSTTALTIAAEAQQVAALPNLGLYPLTSGYFSAGAIPNAWTVAGTMSSIPTSIDLSTAVVYIHYWFGAA